MKNRRDHKLPSQMTWSEFHAAILKNTIANNDCYNVAISKKFPQLANSPYFNPKQRYCYVSAFKHIDPTNPPVGFNDPTGFREVNIAEMDCVLDIYKLMVKLYEDNFVNPTRGRLSQAIVSRQLGYSDNNSNYGLKHYLNGRELTFENLDDNAFYFVRERAKLLALQTNHHGQNLKSIQKQIEQLQEQENKYIAQLEEAENKFKRLDTPVKFVKEKVIPVPDEQIIKKKKQQQSLSLKRTHSQAAASWIVQLPTIRQTRFIPLTAEEKAALASSSSTTTTTTTPDNNTCELKLQAKKISADGELKFFSYKMTCKKPNENPLLNLLDSDSSEEEGEIRERPKKRAKF